MGEMRDVIRGKLARGLFLCPCVTKNYSIHDSKNLIGYNPSGQVTLWESSDFKKTLNYGKLN